MADPTIITLTAIPPRFGELTQTLRALLEQSLPADDIRLHIPRAYARFPDWDGGLPEVPQGVTIFRSDTDDGPASKVLPALRDLAGQSVDILFCDDDKLYDRDWHRRFKAERARRPGEAIVEAGENLPDIDPASRPAARLPRARRRGKGLGYRLGRLLTAGLWRPGNYAASGYVDMLSGWGGVMVRPEFFDAAVFDIPARLRSVDDPWLSGHLERMGVPIWLMAGAAKQRERDGTADTSLVRGTHMGQDRIAADLAAIDHFRDSYGIWPAARQPQPDWLGPNPMGSMRALWLRGRDGRQGG
ncbi:glycosyltransferase family 2 protein [Paracoccus sp. M683]|uniref:glycosyltransferase family 2 protein n=1 Tax=Paracoccus sp. M683 TaxID=2594268 RepID=UPI00163D6436|nr:glycosyltransferase family 2 protein [Paracoccus sp. M683]